MLSSLSGRCNYLAGEVVYISDSFTEGDAAYLVGLGFAEWYTGPTSVPIEGPGSTRILRSLEKRSK